MRSAKALSNTVLVNASRNFRVDGKRMGLMPLVVNKEEGPVPVIQAWIIDCMVRVGDPWNTMEKYTYIICQWYDFLRYRDVPMLDADESHLRDFLLGGGVRESNLRSLTPKTEVTGSSTNRNKFRVIVSFYDFWENKHGKRLRVYHGGTIANVKENAFDRENRSISRAEINFSKPDAESTAPEPGTPSIEEAESVLEVALDRANPNRAQTWYLIGSIALRCGARVGGIESVTVPRFLKALKAEKAFKRVDGYNEIIDGYRLPGNRAKIKQILRNMSSERRTYIFCYVRNKGGDPIPLPIPIALCEEIVEYMCTLREESRKRFVTAKKSVPPNMFLSNKLTQSGGALTSRSMSNFFNPIIKRLKIDGTIHRFRATFAEEVVRDIYIRERAVNGTAWQVKNVLQFASKLLGHKNLDSIQNYLNNIMAQEILAGYPVLVGTAENAAALRGLAARLDDVDDVSFKEVLGKFYEENGIKPITEEGRRYAMF